MNVELRFVVGTKLPLLNDIISSLIEFSPTYNSQKQNMAVSAALDAVYELWKKVFPASYITNKETMRSRIKVILKKYDKNVTLKRNKSKRLLRKSFFQKYEGQIWNILNIEEEKIEFSELKTFYRDQINVRKLTINDVSIFKTF